MHHAGNPRFACWVRNMKRISFFFSHSSKLQRCIWVLFSYASGTVAIVTIFTFMKILKTANIIFTTRIFMIHADICVHVVCPSFFCARAADWNGGILCLPCVRFLLQGAWTRRAPSSTRCAGNHPEENLSTNQALGSCGGCAGTACTRGDVNPWSHCRANLEKGWRGSGFRKTFADLRVAHG